MPSRRVLLASAALILPGVLAAGVVAIPAQGSSGPALRAPYRDSRAFTASLPDRGPDGPGRVGLAEVTGLVNTPQAAASTPSVSPIPEPYAPSKCQKLTGKRCYELFPHLARAYGLDRLHDRGFTGRGATVAVLLPFKNAHVQQDLDVFSRRNGLPRARVEKMTLPGTRAPNPADPGEVVCAQEGTVDVEMIHAVAPNAKIIYVETPVGESSDGSWLASISDAIKTLVTHRKVDVISMSYGAYEANFAETGGGSHKQILKLRDGLKAAARHGVTMVAASGNTGATGPNNTGTGFYPDPTVAWPAGDPLVTAVGGTRLHLDDRGERTAPDEVWTAERNSAGIEGATGGGISAVFDRPTWQPTRIGDKRAIPDLISNASPSSPVWFHSQYQALPGKAPGWFTVGGTSIAAPLIAGVVATAAGRAGHPLGNINSALYRSVRTRGATRSGLTDLAEGCNTANGVTGSCAIPGYDPASGLGTIRDASRLARTLTTTTGSRARPAV